jgi:ribosomal protein S6E (S10)
MRLFSSLAAATVLTAALPAGAATFAVTIKNTSSQTLAPGVVTLAPLLEVGAAPSPGSSQYATYEYAKLGCSVPDEAALLARWGLHAGVDAWVPAQPLAPGAATTLVIQATPSQKLSWLSRSADGQLVMMHAPGDAADLGVPLFDSDGLPRSAIVFELGGYSVSSSSATDGTAAACASACPSPSTRGCFVAPGATSTGVKLPAQPAPQQLSRAWTFQAPAGYETDGLALGDVHPTLGNELVVQMEGGNSAAGVGRAMVLSAASGAPVGQFDGVTAGNDFQGFPMIENLDNSGFSEFLVSEMGGARPAPGAAVYARGGDGSSALWTSTGYGYAGFWNMGPTAADVRRDDANPGKEVVIADYDGDIVVLKRDTAETLNQYNLYAATGDNLYGHAAVANVHAAAGNEIVVVGAQSGRVYVLGAPPVAEGTHGTQPLSLLYTSDPPLNGGYGFGSGPAISDLDGDAKNEIIVATAGVGGVYAYSTSVGGGACKYKWSMPGGFDYGWTSPVVGDVDGDGKPEVIVFSSDSVLSVLKVPAYTGSCTEGTVAWQYTVGNGGDAWFTPALADLTGSGALDVVVANYNTVEVIDVAKKMPVWRYSDASAQFYPSAAIERGTKGGAGAGIYVSGWSNGTVMKLTTPVGGNLPPVDWPTFMGANSRSGSR